VIRVGISGWRYPRWRGTFYPKGLPQHLELAYASNTFSTVELNGSFYSLQTPTSYQRWFYDTPDDFVFALKGSRFITHMLKLRNCEQALERFFDSGVHLLEHKLGPILWQFPATFAWNPERFESFVALLPSGLRHAVEVRHPSFAAPAFFEQLRRFNIALCIADGAGLLRVPDIVTADFAYVRLHGGEVLYHSRYEDRALESWAERMRRWSTEAKDTYVYFDNDAKVHAPFDALRLETILEKRDS
jgi:uncharacterized protein YecE (DUF72 family)